MTEEAAAPNRWLGGDVPRGRAYDRRFDALAASGADVHGEASLVASLRPSSVLDAGCGTGRVAIELVRRGIAAVGVDLDPDMLAAARAKAPDVEWVQADLATMDLGRTFDLAVMAGNVLLFTAAGSEGAVVSRVAAHLPPGGLVVAGFSIRPGGLGAGAYGELAARAGLVPVERWSTWTREPWDEAGDYLVAVDRRRVEDGAGGSGRGSVGRGTAR